jgi:hypothetical protein
MIVAWNSRGMGNPLIFHDWFQYHALANLADHRAPNLLPGRLGGRISIAAGCFEHRAAGGQFGFGRQHIDPAARQIDPDAGTG